MGSLCRLPLLLGKGFFYSTAAAGPATAFGQNSVPWPSNADSRLEALQGSFGLFSASLGLPRQLASWTAGPGFSDSPEYRQPLLQCPA